tara:strand:- start:212 stop:463 length:252 start_codon:yes stop_codon:yes gene_type:complete
MNKNETLDHMLALTEEVNILTQRLQPQATGHIHTTINTLRDRIDELKKELYDKPAYIASGGEGLDGLYTGDEMREWEEKVDHK